MRKKLFFALVLLSFSISFVNGVPTGQGQQLFFDNFSTSQLSPNWIPNVLGISGNTNRQQGNLTQAGGWLTLTVPRSLINNNPGCGGVCYGINSIMATAHAPIITSQVVTTSATIPSLDGLTSSLTSTSFAPSGTFNIANTVSGRLMIFFISINTGIGFSAPTVSSLSGTHDSGWTLRKSLSGNSGSNLAYEYYSTATSTSDSVTVTLSGNCNANGCTFNGQEFEIQSSTGLDSFGPQSASSSGSSGSSSITMSFHAASLVFGYTQQLSVTTISYGVGFNGLYNFGGQASEYDNGHSGVGSTSVTFGYNPVATWMSIADAVDGTASTTNRQNSQTGFFYSAWRLIPFNLTQIGNNPGSNNSQRDATVILGFFNNTAFSGIGIEMSEVDNINDGQFLAPGSQRETISLTINSPQTGNTPNCYATYMGFLGAISPNIIGCASAHSSFIYSTPDSPIDLNAPHIFTLEMNLKTDGSSWVAMEVDQNGWFNVTQTACTCIESSEQTYASLYPFIMNGYAVNNIAINPPTPNQSLGTQLQYILVDNYVPSNLPTPSNPPLKPSSNPLNIPTTNNPIFNPFGGINPSAIWQYYANVIGNGVPTISGNFLVSPFFFGGAVLYVISILTMLGVLFFVANFKGTRITSPFMLGMFVFFITVANFLMGTLEWWIFASVSIFMIAIMVNAVPSALGGNQGGIYNV